MSLPLRRLLLAGLLLLTGLAAAACRGADFGAPETLRPTPSPVQDVRLEGCLPFLRAMVAADERYARGFGLYEVVAGELNNPAALRTRPEAAVLLRSQLEDGAAVIREVGEEVRGLRPPPAFREYHEAWLSRLPPTEGLFGATGERLEAVLRGDGPGEQDARLRAAREFEGFRQAIGRQRAAPYPLCEA